MKKIIIYLSVLFLAFNTLFLYSCKKDVKIEEYNHRIINTQTPLKDLEYWKSTEVSGEANTVILELSHDVDLLYWTKENGEYLEINRKDLNYIQSFKYYVKDGPFTFTFKEPGTYILNIYQKPNKKENLNLEDVDFRGKVKIGNKTVKLTDKGYAGVCKKQALYTITNDSKNYGEGNIMTEFIYAHSLGRKWDPNRKCNYAVYETICKYDNLFLDIGKSITLLLPMGENVDDTRYGYAVLKPVQKDNNTFYYIHTTNVPSSHNRVTKMGHRWGSSNGMLTYVKDNQFEMPWKM